MVRPVWTHLDEKGNLSIRTALIQIEN